MATSFHDVIKSKYLLLTTFTKDGRPKPTAIWGVPEGDKLLVITDDGSWKTKRIKNTPRVTIAKSGSLGKPKSDDVEGVATGLEDRRQPVEQWPSALAQLVEAAFDPAYLAKQRRELALDLADRRAQPALVAC